MQEENQIVTSDPSRNDRIKANLGYKTLLFLNIVFIILIITCVLGPHAEAFFEGLNFVGGRDWLLYLFPGLVYLLRGDFLSRWDVQRKLTQLTCILFVGVSLCMMIHNVLSQPIPDPEIITPEYTPMFTPTTSISSTSIAVPTEFPRIPYIGTMRDIFVREGPSLKCPQIGILEQGTYWKVNNITADREWFEIELPDGQRGWVSASQTAVVLSGSIASVHGTRIPSCAQ